MKARSFSGERASFSSVGTSKVCKRDQGDTSMSLALGTTGGQQNVLGIQKVPIGTQNMSWCRTIEKCNVQFQQRSGAQRRIWKASESFLHNRGRSCCPQDLMLLLKTYLHWSKHPWNATCTRVSRISLGVSQQTDSHSLCI